MMKVSTKVDVFSFGVMAMELLTKKRPTGLTDENGFPITLPQLIQKALQHGEIKLDQLLDPYLTSYTANKHQVLESILHLALSCTSTDPVSRPDMEQVLSSLTKIQAKI